MAAASRALTDDQARKLIDQLLGADHRHTLKEDGSVDFSFQWTDRGRVRGNAFHQRGSVAVALRAIPSQIPGFGELRLPAVAADPRDRTDRRGQVDHPGLDARLDQ